MTEKIRTQGLANIATKELVALLVIRVDQLNDVGTFLGAFVVEVEVDDVYGSLSEVDGGANSKTENEADALVNGAAVFSKLAEEGVARLVGG